MCYFAFTSHLIGCAGYLTFSTGAAFTALSTSWKASWVINCLATAFGGMAMLNAMLFKCNQAGLAFNFVAFACMLVVVALDTHLFTAAQYENQHWYAFEWIAAIS